MFVPENLKIIYIVEYRRLRGTLGHAPGASALLTRVCLGCGMRKLNEYFDTRLESVKDSQLS